MSALSATSVFMVIIQMRAHLEIDGKDLRLVKNNY